MLIQARCNDQQGGFSLPEMLLAMLFSSMMMVSVAAMYPELQRQSMSLYRLYRLEQSMRQVLLMVEKDMRRAGFLLGDGNGKESNGIRLSAHTQSEPNSCMIVQYDLNHNGVIDPPESAMAEQFAYRWLNGTVEQARGTENCHGSGWEKLLDPAEIVITQFLIERVAQDRLPDASPADASGYFIITLAGHWKRWPALTRRLTSRVRERH
ncbi:prepilin peptidase-dependent protein [Pragia fontium]|uniref:Prepilin peptidase dependent protein B n=2 Tax=Pragia fontium TaxID=82985 RepID=A0AAJ4WA56_9GAMM|nr:prepilin peptidase-dependent protein [Pragia fontium]GKX63535.1 cleavage protein [Pragia fontium]SFC67670.1 prepilin peptidase dependent protein B [Pragia fontium DSM 5563 = ATCC 49100]VEJ56430.1 Type II secretory pathway, component PulJ [Pragia fontium]